MDNFLILLVDDSPTQRRHAQRQLQQCGANVITAGDGIEAIQHAHDFLPDLILMDIDMPFMNGLQACRELRQNRFTADIPVLMLSSREDLASRLRAAMRGAVGYLVKPVARDKLCRKVEKVLKQSPTP